MKTQNEIENRVRLINGLRLSHREGLVELTEKKLNDLRFEIEILEWVLSPTTRDSENLKNNRMPPIQPFRKIPRATKGGGKARDIMLEYIKENPLISRTELAKKMLRTNAGTIPILDILVDLNLIKQIKFRDERKYYYYSSEESDDEMKDLLSDRRLDEMYNRDEKRKDRVKKLYEKRKDKRVNSQDWKKAKKLIPMLSKMKDEAIVDNEKWTKEFSKKAEKFKRTHTAEEYEEFLNKLNRLQQNDR